MAWLRNTRPLRAAVVAAVAVTYLVLRLRLPPATVSTIELIAIGLLLGTLVVSTAILAVASTGALIAAATSQSARLRLARLRAGERVRPWLRRTRGAAFSILACVLVLAGLVIASQWTAHTPPITGEEGKLLPGSIASLEKVRLGGVDQWLIVRGNDVSKPVLLFLSGGPGGSEAGRVLRFNRELEKHFVVVIWEQRGCAKSYPSGRHRGALTVDQYTSDIIELSGRLRERFDEEKIYLVGHSWGTIIGLRAVQQRPDLFHAYVGTSQMVNVRETDQIIYDKLMEHARQTGDTEYVQRLEAQGPPPYGGKNPVRPYARLFTREYQVFEMSSIKSEAFRREGDLLQLALRQPEYGWWDRINYLRSLVTTFNALYPQLQELDFRRDGVRLDLPVYLVLGRHDMNNPSRLPEDYFDRLQAPSKELIVFEDSGHGMIWQEPDRFYDLMVHTVLAETYRP
jgi:pimeloyl-ACP methyl ester carboxylesterase